MKGVGRNDACPCGSGKKYKKCHLRADEDAPPSAEKRAEGLHRLDNALADRLVGFAVRRFGEDFGQIDLELIFSAEDGRDVNDPAAMQFVVPWLLYEKDVGGGATVAETYLARCSRDLSETERAWLASQCRARYSIWEVTEVKRGLGVAVRDLLTGEERFVHEVRGSQVLGPRDALLARVVDHDGLFLFCGLHGRPLQPREAATVIDSVRRTVKARTKRVRPELLRPVEIRMLLPVLWRSAVQAFDSRPPPELRNTDGDPLLLTTDLFTIVDGACGEIVEKLGALRGALRADEAGSICITVPKPGNKVHQSWEVTNIGYAEISASELRVSSNSTRRANQLRKRVERVCGDLVAHTGRTQNDPTVTTAERAAPNRRRTPEPKRPEELEALRHFKEQGYADWVDRSIPALGGLTPREAAARKEARAELDLLLREMENHEGRLPEEERYDLDQLRRMLGLKVARSPKPGASSDQLPLPLR
jgi:hypothetical protein